jgi:hypothetical protein
MAFLDRIRKAVSKIKSRPVGKKIGGSIYLHKDYADSVIPKELMDKAKAAVGQFDYTIAKYTPAMNSISFIRSPDWDTAHEPTVGVVKAYKDGIVKTINPSSDPWIYHHKWQFVGDDYKGFNVEESKARSKAWEPLNLDRSRIGKKSYWDAVTAGKLDKSMPKAALATTAGRHPQSPGQSAQPAAPAHKPANKGHVRADTQTIVSLINENELRKAKKPESQEIPAFQYHVDFKEHKPNAYKPDGYAQWEFTKPQLAHILKHWDTVVAYEPRVKKAKRNNQQVNELDPTVKPRDKTPSVPLRQWLKKNPVNVGTALYDGVGDDHPGVEQLGLSGHSKVDRYDKFHPEDEVRVLPTGQYDNVHSHYTLNVTTPEEGKEVVQRLHDRLKDNGKAIISVRRDKYLEYGAEPSEKIIPFLKKSANLEKRTQVFPKNTDKGTSNGAPLSLLSLLKKSDSTTDGRQIPEVFVDNTPMQKSLASLLRVLSNKSEKRADEPIMQDWDAVAEECPWSIIKHKRQERRPAIVGINDPNIDESLEKSLSKGPAVDQQIADEVEATLPQELKNVPPPAYHKPKALTALFRSYKHTPHDPDSLFLKFLVHRTEHRAAYARMSPQEQKDTDAKWLAFHQQGKAKERNGSVTTKNLYDFLRTHTHLVSNLLSSQRQLHKKLQSYSPEEIVNINGKPHVKLFRGLNVAPGKEGADHSLASYADNSSTPYTFGHRLHTRHVPLDNIWFSFDAGPKAASDGEHGAEDEYLVSNHPVVPVEHASKEEGKAEELKDRARKLVPYGGLRDTIAEQKTIDLLFRAKKPNATEADWDKLMAVGDHVATKFAIDGARHVPEGVMNKIIGAWEDDKPVLNSDSMVMRGLLNRPELPSTGLQRIFDVADKSANANLMRSVIDHPNATSDMLQSVIDHGTTEGRFWPHSMLESIPAHPNATPAQIKQLVYHPSSYVRVNALIRAPLDEVVNQLKPVANGTSALIDRAAAATILSHRKDLPSEIVDKFASITNITGHVDAQLRENALAHPGLSDQKRYEVATAGTPDLKDIVAKNPKLDTADVHALLQSGDARVHSSLLMNEDLSTEAIDLAVDHFTKDADRPNPAQLTRIYRHAKTSSAARAKIYKHALHCYDNAEVLTAGKEKVRSLGNPVGYLVDPAKDLKYDAACVLGGIATRPDLDNYVTDHIIKNHQHPLAGNMHSSMAESSRLSPEHSAKLQESPHIKIHAPVAAELPPLLMKSDKIKDMVKQAKGDDGHQYEQRFMHGKDTRVPGQTDFRLSRALSLPQKHFPKVETTAHPDASTTYYHHTAQKDNHTYHVWSQHKDPTEAGLAGIITAQTKDGNNHIRAAYTRSLSNKHIDDLDREVSKDEKTQYDAPIVLNHSHMEKGWEQHHPDLVHNMVPDKTLGNTAPTVTTWLSFAGAEGDETPRVIMKRALDNFGDLKDQGNEQASYFDHSKFSTSHREAAYSHLANKVFGLGEYVPRTTVFRHPLSNEPWSSMEFIRGASDLRYPREKLAHMNSSGDLHKMAIMNAILGNNDRHGNNVLLGADNKPILIDNGLSFDYNNRVMTSPIPHYAEHIAHDSYTPKNLHHWIENLDTAKMITHLKEMGAPHEVVDTAAKRMESTKLWSRMIKQAEASKLNVNGSLSTLLKLIQARRLGMSSSEFGKIANDIKQEIGLPAEKKDLQNSSSADTVKLSDDGAEAGLKPTILQIK